MIEAYWKFRFLTEVFGSTIILCIILAWLGTMAYFYYVKPFIARILKKIFNKC